MYSKRKNEKAGYRGCRCIDWNKTRLKSSDRSPLMVRNSPDQQPKRHKCKFQSCKCLTQSIDLDKFLHELLWWSILQKSRQTFGKGEYLPCWSSLSTTLPSGLLGLLWKQPANTICGFHHWIPPQWIWCSNSTLTGQWSSQRNQRRLLWNFDPRCRLEFRHEKQRTLFGWCWTQFWTMLTWIALRLRKRCFFLSNHLAGNNGWHWENKKKESGGKIRKMRRVTWK